MTTHEHPTNQPSLHPNGHPNECPAAETVASLRSAVAGLAREVEAISRAMRHVAPAGELTRLARVVTELGDTVAAHLAGQADTDTSGDTGASSGAGSGAGGVPVADGPPSWMALPHNPRDARGLLDDLVSWMAGVYLRYTDAARGLPECWLWHPDIVEELVWLQQAWLAAYVADDASIRAAGDWHDRLRPGVVRRIHECAKACSLENHLPTHATTAPEVPVLDAVDAVADWWGERRSDPGPTPTDDQMIAAAALARRARSTSTALAAPTTDQMIAHAANASTAANGGRRPRGGTRS